VADTRFTLDRFLLVFGDSLFRRQKQSDSNKLVSQIDLIDANRELPISTEGGGSARALGS